MDKQDIMPQLMWWHNYKTGEYDYRERPTSDEEAIKYIPQLDAAQGLYQCLREMGKDILEAMKEVLIACLPEDSREMG